MTPNTAELAEALRERLRIIADESSRRDPERHLERLRLVSERIERAAAALPHPVPKQLAHFLERGSYEKALEFIGGQRQNP